ncbi:MAG: esterase [Salinivirgaceae bacterium]|nr:esterase [Salinivirgaceae bacterium]
MKKISLFAAAIAVMASFVACNQQDKKQQEQRLTPEVMARLFPRPVVSPDYNADGSVTFRYKSESAQTVLLDCQMFSEKKEMTKDTNNVWSVTVKPEVPDIYPYCFIVDGIQVTDPSNMFIFPNEGFKNSLCDVRGEVPSMQDLQDVPHGKVSYRYYHSNGLGFDRPMCVYTPAGYNPSADKKYPVLYLIHGMTDTYETWFKVGRMNNIMDNLIAKGLAKPMIVVMPYANPNPEMEQRHIEHDFNIMGTDVFVKEMLNEVIPFVEANYKVKTDADSRAIAGFSLGGRQTLATGFGNPDKFHYVAAFAPAIFGNEFEANFQNGTYAPISDLQKKLKFFFLGTGSEDFLIQASRDFDKYLTDKKLKHTFYNPGGGHTWMNCRDYLELTAKELFK